MMNLAKVFRNKLLWMMLILGAALCWISRYSHQPPRINVDASIREGMSEEEVIAALGAPPGDYLGSSLKFEFLAICCSDAPAAPGSYTRKWTAENGIVYVHFSREGKVLYTYSATPLLHESWWDAFVATCRSWFGW